MGRKKFLAIFRVTDKRKFFYRKKEACIDIFRYTDRRIIWRKMFFYEETASTWKPEELSHMSNIVQKLFIFAIRDEHSNVVACFTFALEHYTPAGRATNSSRADRDVLSAVASHQSIKSELAPAKGSIRIKRQDDHPGDLLIFLRTTSSAQLCN